MEPPVRAASRCGRAPLPNANEAAPQALSIQGTARQFFTNVYRAEMSLAI